MTARELAQAKDNKFALACEIIETLTDDLANMGEGYGYVRQTTLANYSDLELKLVGLDWLPGLSEDDEDDGREYQEDKETKRTWDDLTEEQKEQVIRTCSDILTNETGEVPSENRARQVAQNCVAYYEDETGYVYPDL